MGQKSLVNQSFEYIVVVIKTLRYSNVFFYNPLCRNADNRNVIMNSGIKKLDNLRQPLYRTRTTLHIRP